MIVETKFTLQELWDTANLPKSIMTVEQYERLEHDLNTLAEMYDPAFTAGQLEFIRSVLPGLLRRKLPLTLVLLEAMKIPLTTKFFHTTNPFTM